MFSKILNRLSYHKDGIESLKIIHKIDRSIIPLFIIQSVISAFFPYIELFITTHIIDSIINKNLYMVPYLITGLILSNLVIGLLIDLLDNINKYKANTIHRKMIKLINQKALEIDYDIMEDTGVLQKLSNAQYTMEHTGGYNEFIRYYRDLLEGIIRIITSVSLTVGLCFTTPVCDSKSLQVFSSTPFTLIILTGLTIMNIKYNSIVANKFTNSSVEVHNQKMTAERKFSYYIMQVFLNYPMGKDIRIYNMFEMLHNNFDKYQKVSYDFFSIFYGKNLLKKDTYTLLSNSIYMYVAYLLVIVKILAGCITIGDFTKYIGAISIFSTAIVAIIYANQRIKLQTEFIKIYNEFINLENKKHTGSLPIEKRRDHIYNIEFHDVSFKYPCANSYTIEHVSCKLTLKNKMAVVGRNGAGKTTFIKLLCRLYDPTEGYITLNGIDIRKYDYDEYLSVFSVVFQDFNLFALPLRENIAANSIANDDKVWECLSMSGASDRVKQMPENIYTNLYKYDEDGVEISGGEAQKIAISRALYKDAAFVILDEPTSALDPISEFEIYSKFNELVEDKTSLFISHRMSSCRFCDDILVFDNGRIIQRGDHDTLMMDENNVYASLFNAQAKYYKKSSAEA